MHTAKVFKKGNSQAVRLPKEFEVTESELYIQKVGNSIILTPKKDPWKTFRNGLDNFSDDFMEDGRCQGEHQESEGLFPEEEVTGKSMIEVVEAKYIKEYRIWFKFNNGESGEVDLKDHLIGSMFIPLKELSEFRKFRLSPEFGTIIWENDADFAPEFLLSHINTPD